MTISDKNLWQAIEKEQQRQEEHIELIASENYVSKEVLLTQGTVLTNKYAEGYPGKRYYGGCEHVDEVEQLAIDRAKQLFDADYANVQPHSGAQANAAAFLALLEPNDTILGMNLSEGGHLTHGSAVNFSGRLYRAEHYGINNKGLLDYDQLRDMAHKHSGNWSLSRSSPLCSCSYQHDSQNSKRTKRGNHTDEEPKGIGKENELSGIPRHSRRPSDACHSRQSRSFL